MQQLSIFLGMLLNIFLLMLGVYCCSTSVIFIKLSTENPILLAAYRLILAGIIMLPLFKRELKKHQFKYSMEHFRSIIAPGILMGLHFITWILGARMTPAANASLMVNCIPLAMPFVMFVLIREIITKKEMLGSAIALCGVFLFAFTDFHISRETFKGDLICLLSMVMLAFYWGMARKNRGFPSAIIYTVPLYLLAGIFCFLISLFFMNPIKPYTTQNLLCLLGLTVFPTIFGHTLINRSMTVLRGQIVSVANVSQFIFAGLMGFFILGEVPRLSLLPAAILVFIGLTTVLISKKAGKNRS